MLRQAALGLCEALHGPASTVRNNGLSVLRQWYSVKVVVPQMGDSISEGSVAAVLKQPGDAVKENDAILQIETDKVTIDVKSPVDGTLVGLLVKTDDTVTPGQLVGTVDESTAKANLIGAQPTPPPKQEQASPTTNATPAPQQEPSSFAASRTSSKPDSGAAHSRRTCIHFPARRTAAGERISAMDADEAHRLQQEQQPSSSATGSKLSSSSGGYGNVDQASTPKTAATAAQKATAGQPAVPAAGGGKRSASVMHLKEMPAKRELTEAEIEAIMLGGA